MPQHFGREERVALGALGDESRELRRRVASDHAGDEGANRRDIKPAQRQPYDVVLATKCRQHVGKRMRTIEFAFAVGRDDRKPRGPC